MRDFLKTAGKISAALVVAAFLGGCAARTPVEDMVTAREFPGGYLYSGGTYGGDVLLESVQISDGEGGDDFVATMTFLAANGAELSQTPVFYVYALDNPARLVIRANVASHYGGVVGENGGAGYFLEESGGYFSLYIQLANDFVFSVSEDAGKLTFSLGAIFRPRDALFYPIALPENDGEMDSAIAIGMTPVLYNGRVAYIGAEGFDDRQTAADSISAQFAHITAAQMDELFDSTGNPHSAEIAQAALYLDTSGEEASAQYWLHGALYLCPLLNEPAMLFYDGGIVKYGYDGAANDLGFGEFTDIKKAAADSDGRYLAVLSSAGLQVFDLLSGAEIDVLQAVMGIEILSFDWGDDGKLYVAPAGENAVYSLNIADNTLQSRRTESALAGEIGAGGGRVYYACADGAIWYSLIAADSDDSTRLVSGGDFALSPNGKMLSVLYENAGDANAFSGLVLINIESGGVAQVYEGGDLAAYLFSMNNQYLHYLVEDGADVDYPYALYSYKMSDDSRYFHGRLKMADVFALAEGNMAMASEIGGQVSAAYMLRLNYYEKMR